MVSAAPGRQIAFRRFFRLTVLAVTLLAWLEAVGPLAAQVVARPRRAIRVVVAQNGDDSPTDAAIDGVFLPPDRTVKRRLDRARESLDQQRYGEAVRYLGSLLEGSEDYFFKPDAKQPVYQSLKSAAGKLLATMPKAGVESYELQFGARARRMLNDAIAQGNIDALGEVSRRFFYTTAGCEATLVLGRNHLDHGQPLAAALCFERLRSFDGARDRYEPLLSVYLAACWSRSGMPQRSAEVLAELRKKYPDAELRIAGKASKLFGEGAVPLASILEPAAQSSVGQRPAQRWTMFRGDWTRNGQSAGGRPLLDHRWQQHTVDYPAVERLVAQLRQGYLDNDIAALPSLHPLAVGDVIVMRTWRNLLAVDFKTGKRVWQAIPAVEDPFEQLVSSGNQQYSQSLMRAAQQRMWQDVAFGTLSSDGDRVFAVEELGIAPGEDYQQRTIFLPNGQRRTSWPKSSNKLAAYELRTEGKLKWEVGGELGADEPRLAGAFFLGAPLPVQSKLYVLAEMRGQEIRLVVLSAQTGALEWSQQLAVVEQNIVQDPMRRLSGATPSFADGVLVCPTSAGAIVAMDLTTRSLLWGYQYPREQVDRLQSMQGFGTIPGRGDQQRWVDGTATVVQGKVVITPIEGDHLYCLNLVDGKLLWKQDRGTNVYVACIHDGKVILVGQHAVSAVSLASGESVWSAPLTLPDGALPSGRGYYTGKQYFLPLSIGEVAQIDLDRAAIVSRARSRRGSIPGNLICFHDEVISQGVDYLETYYQLDPLKVQVTEELRRNPQDPKALAQLGTIKLDEGNLTEAIALFKRSYGLAADDFVREKLVDSVLEGLRSDFAAHRAAAEELEPLIERADQKTAYLRLFALGLQRQGNVASAFAAFMRLSAADGQLDHMDELDSSLSVRRDRWLREQLARLYGGARPAERASIETVVAAQLRAALAKNTESELRRFIGLYAALPQAQDAREALVAKLSGKQTLLERELLLTALAASSDEARQRSASARLAALYREAARFELAAAAYKQLLDRWADQVCLNGKTGRQLFAEVPAGDPVKAAAAGPKPWPAGQVITQFGPARPLTFGQRVPNIELQTRSVRPAALTDLSFFFDTQQQTLIARDGYGKVRSRLPLGEQLSRRNYGFGTFNGSAYPAANHFAAAGNLLVVFMGSQVVAVDALRPQEPAASSVVWSQDMNEQIPGMATRTFQPRPVNVPWGPTRFAAYDDFGRPVGSLGPVMGDAIYLQRFRDVLCIEPLTGETLWTRKNVAPGSELFGDGELLFCAPPEGNEAMVLSATDGQLLGQRHVVPPEQRVLTFGRDVLSWELRNAKPTLSLTDAWTGYAKWSHAFAPGVKLWLAGTGAVGILEPTGRFVVVSVPDGKLVVDDRVLPERSLSGLYLLPSRDYWVLVTKSHPRGYDAKFLLQPGPGGMGLPMVTGRMYCYDRKTGRRLWKDPVKLQQYGLWLAQPSESPILTLLRASPGAWSGAGQAEAKTSVLCIDKRNGRTVLAKDNVASSTQSGFEILVEPAVSRVSLAFADNTVNFMFTDKPLAPENEKRGGLSNIAEAIYESFGNAVHDLGAPTEDAPTDDD